MYSGISLVMIYKLWSKNEKEFFSFFFSSASFFLNQAIEEKFSFFISSNSFTSTFSIKLETSV
jgi:hypothetical protein